VRKTTAKPYTQAKHSKHALMFKMLWKLYSEQANHQGRFHTSKLILNLLPIGGVTQYMHTLN